MFSIHQLLLDLNEYFQGIADQKKLRYVTQYLTPEVNIVRASESDLKPILIRRIHQAFEESINGTVQVTVTYVAPNLLVNIINTESNTTYGDTLFPLEYHAEDQLLEQDMVRKWQMRDIEMSDLLLLVLKSILERINAMEAAYDTGDYDTLKLMVHSAKGLTGSYQMTELYEVFIDFDAHMKSVTFIDDVTADYMEQIKTILSLIPERYL